MKAAKELSELIANATLKIVAGGGHELNREKAQPLAEILRDFYGGQA